MRHLNVHWTEGLFLRPHHFQALERAWAERLALSMAATDPCGYGLVRFEIDPAALANRKFEVRRCQAVLRDGTLVWLEPGEEPGRLDLAAAGRQVAALSAAVGQALEVADTIRVYLAVPKFDPVGPNVAPPGGEATSHSLVVRRSLPDDTTGGNDAELEFRRLNVQLKLSTDDLSGFELLPVAQIRRAGNREAAPEIDTDFFPPLLAIGPLRPVGAEQPRRPPGAHLVQLHLHHGDHRALVRLVRAIDVEELESDML